MKQEQTDYKAITVRFNEEELKAIEERMDYLKETTGIRNISYADAIRNAVMKTNYKREKRTKEDE